MKLKIVSLLILCIVLSSCKDKQKQDIEAGASGAKIEGTILGYSEVIPVSSINELFQLAPDASGQFSLEIDTITKGIYTFSFGMENRFSVYLKENTILNLAIDYNKLLNREKNAITATGQHINETKLLLALNENKPGNNYSRVDYKEEYLPMINTKNPEDFEQYQLEELEKIKALIAGFKGNHPDLDPEFLKILNLETLLEFNSKFRLYENYHTYFAPEIEVDLPEKFKDYFAKEIPQKDFDLYAKSSSYKSYVGEQYYAILGEQLKDYPPGSLSYYKAQVEFLDHCDFPQIIKDGMYQGLTIGYMRSQDPETKAWLDKTIAEKVTDESALKRFNGFKAKEVAYSDGDIAPDFTLKNIEGIDVSLSDFKGSVVYIDLWATWCGPCIKGLPYFKKLKEKYKNKNIKFVMLSFDEDMAAWEKMVKENRDGLFEGIQLATGSYQNEINATYNINGIPHYILIGADGKIVQKNAMDPYNPELISVLDGLLKT